VVISDGLQRELAAAGGAEIVMEGDRAYFVRLDVGYVLRLAEENASMKRALENRLRIDEGSELQWRIRELELMLEAVCKVAIANAADVSARAASAHAQLQDFTSRTLSARPATEGAPHVPA
jgi:hypothetical protein